MTSVSVIIPAYQNATTILEAITSVLNQSIQEGVEIIVVNDGSTDNLEGTLSPLMDKITYLRQDNLGSASARNLGIVNSSGEIIAFLDADDVWLPEKLELQLPIFKSNQKVGLVFGNLKYLSEGKVQSATYFDFLTPHRGNVFLELFASNFVPTTSVLVRRQVFQQVGLFDETLRIVQDYHLWLRIARLWQIDYIAAPVALYRIGSQQITKNLVKSASLLLQVKEDIYESNIELFDEADNWILERGLYNKYLRLALCYMRESKKENARQVLDRYFRIRGRSAIYLVFRVLTNLPTPMMLLVVKVWDMIHQKPKYGIY